MPIESEGAHENFTSFGSFLQFLRLRVGKNLRDMALAVGYSEAHLSRIERGERRPPRRALLLARFVPALELEQEPGLSARLLELAEHDRQLLSPARLPVPIYAMFLASYRPIEARSKRWAVICPDQTTRRLRVQAYCDFVASASHSWPEWPPPIRRHSCCKSMSCRTSRRWRSRPCYGPYGSSRRWAGAARL